MPAPPNRTFTAGPGPSVRSANQTAAEKLEYTCLIDPTESDTVSSATWSITPSATVGSPTNSGNGSTVLVSGLTSGTRYTLAATLTGASTQIFAGQLEIDCISAHQ